MDSTIDSLDVYFEESNLPGGIKGYSVFTLWEIWST